MHALLSTASAIYAPGVCSEGGTVDALGARHPSTAAARARGVGGASRAASIHLTQHGWVHFLAAAALASNGVHTRATSRIDGGAADGSRQPHAAAAAGGRTRRYVARHGPARPRTVVLARTGFRPRPAAAAVVVAVWARQAGDHADRRLPERRQACLGARMACHRTTLTGC
jgi:hypothetical protein